MSSGILGCILFLVTHDVLVLCRGTLFSLLLSPDDTPIYPDAFR